MNTIKEPSSSVTVNLNTREQFSSDQRPTRHLQLCNPKPIECNPPNSTPDGETFLAKVVEKFSEVIEGLMGILEKTLQALSSQAQSETPAAPAGDAPAATPTDGSKGTKETKAGALPKTGEFLWKPESDKDGNLVVLLPGRYTGKVKGLKILDAKTREMIARGKSSGTGNPMNGKDREHFRFNRPGGSIPDNSIVQITLEGGKKIEFKIPETSKRYEK